MSETRNGTGGLAHGGEGWAEIKPGLYRFADSCVVYAYETGGGMVVVNAGTGAWVDHLDRLPSRPVCVVLTHFFRDHSAGAVRAAEFGIPVWAPYGEREQLADPRGLFSRRETYIMYDNVWDLFAPIQPIPVDRWLQDGETLTVGDTEITVVPTPGVSVGAVTLLTRRGGETGAFCGELIHEPGKILRVAPLQYNYNDFDGAPNLLYSIRQVKGCRPDWLAGSTGPAVIDEPGPAFDALERNLMFALTTRGEYEEKIACATDDALDEITPHLYRSRYSEASSYFLVSDSGKVLSIDYGYRRGVGWGEEYAFPRHRRPLLHGLEALKRQAGTDRIDAVLVTHFHDDHVNGIPLLQRLQGTRCFAADTFAFLLADPERYAFPCTWPGPIDVTSIPAGSPFQWEEFTFTLHPISGHTRFATLIGFEVDGERVVATGDQYFLRDPDSPEPGPAYHNHVYRNGAMLGSFVDSTKIMKNLDPTIILPGHGSAFQVGEEWFEKMDRYAADYEKIHRDLMPLGDDDLHFEVDSRAAWLEPYRTRVDTPGTIPFVAHVRNPYPERIELVLKMALPTGWTCPPAALTLAPRAEGTAALNVLIPQGTAGRRLPVALEMIGPDRNFGQVAEALVTVGHPLF